MGDADSPSSGEFNRATVETYSEDELKNFFITKTVRRDKIADIRKSVLDDEAEDPRVTMAKVDLLNELSQSLTKDLWTIEFEIQMRHLP